MTLIPEVVGRLDIAMVPSQRTPSQIICSNDSFPYYYHVFLLNLGILDLPLSSHYNKQQQQQQQQDGVFRDGHGHRVQGAGGRLPLGHRGGEGGHHGQELDEGGPAYV